MESVRKEASLVTSIIAASLVAGAAQAQQAQEVEEILIVEERINSGYSEIESNVGFGFPAELRRIPQSIQVVNSRLIDDIKPLSLSDIVRSTGGASAGRNSVEPFSSFKVRGFRVGQTIVDGIRNTNSLNIQAEGIANIERVEILRGPGGAVYGLSSPGGVINVVTRKPQSTPRYEASVTVGNFDHRQIDADLTGPVTEDGALRYRLIGGYEERDSFIDFIGVERFQISPSLEWEHSSGAVFRYQGDYRDREGLRYISLPVPGSLTGADVIDPPLSLFTGEPAQGDTLSESLMHTLSFEKAGDGPNMVHAYARFTTSDYDQPSVAPANMEEDGRTLNRRYNRFVEDQEETIVGIQIVREVEIGNLTPTISAGLDYADWTYDSVFNRGSVAPIDVLTPVYGATIGSTFVLASSIDQFRQLGGYVQGVFEFGEDVTMLVGTRWDRLENDTESVRRNRSASTTDTEFSPRLGLSWEVSPGFVPYASYSETFEANPSFGSIRSPSGALFGPQEGQQWEVGAKFDGIDGLTSTIAYFNIELSNVLTADPSDPAFRIPTGEQRSRGFEWSNTWQPVDNFTLMGNYAYTDAEVTQDTNLPAGTPLENVPEHSMRLWARYAREFGEGWIGGVTGGWTNNSSVFIGLGNPIEIPRFDVWEAGAFLQRGPLSFELKIDNATDEEYFLRGAFGGNGVVPGDARRVLVTMAWRP
ncbi:MAG: TonB-dependent siderophore receptor [Pseudomonadales bacterium]|nr:TonB-dependent siderophore receptor [Pseudomonadales bacterium]